MELGHIFSEEEKKAFLIKKGYQLVEYDHDYWVQWGNHDSQGNWEIQKFICAVRKGEMATRNNVFTSVFEREIQQTLKQLLLLEFNVNI
jgi:hypothetical protein